MKPAEISNLAKATCSWLAYRHYTGFERVLSEAMLSVPISEFLASQTSWELKTEFGYRHLPDGFHLPSFWCDFAGSRGVGSGIRFLLEAKYLKRPIEKMAKHVAADIIRLSLPQNKEVTRLFLLAGKRHHFQQQNDPFLFDQIFKLNLDKRKGCDLNLEEAATNAGFLKSYPILEAPIRIGNEYFRPKSAYVQCRAIEEFPNIEDGYKVVVWSIARGRLVTTAPPILAL